MIKVDVVLEDNLLEQLQAQLSAFSGSNGGRIAPGTKSAFDMASKLIQKSWQNWAMGGSLPGVSDIKNPNSRLASSIKIRSINDFDVSIETDSRYMERIQNGTPAFDMKETYPYGHKSRVSKKGIPYLIIPFQWGTPNREGGGRAHIANTIPLEVYKILQSRNFKKSVQKTETHIEPNAKGEGIERHEYEWGDRINDEDLGNANGMVRMKSNPTSTYFTFRVISAKSPEDAWKRKAVPANHVVEAVESSTRKQVEDILQAGLESDLGL